MTNLETAIDVLARHREGRQWTDEAVAADLLAELGVDPAGLPAMTEAKAATAETAAHELLAKAQAAADHARATRVALAPPPPAVVPGPVIDAPWMPEDNAVEPVGGTSGMIEALPPVAAETHE